MNDQINPATLPETTIGHAGQIETLTSSAIEGPFLKTAEQDSQPRPSPGRIVSYTVTADQAREINNRRAHADAHRAMHKSAANGTVIHMGSTVTEGRRFPMIITAVHGDAPTSAINGQVFLDGNDSLWVTSVTLGDQPGNYSWPSRD